MIIEDEELDGTKPKLNNKTMKGIINALRRAFGKVLEFLVSRGQVAVKATDIVKQVIENPFLDWTVRLTPIKADDAILAKAKQLVPQIGVKIGMAMGIINEVNQSESTEQAFGKVLEYVSKSLPVEGRAIFYRELSGQLAESLSDGQMSTAEAIAIVQLIFKKKI